MIRQLPPHSSPTLYATTSIPLHQQQQTMKSLYKSLFLLLFLIPGILFSDKRIHMKRVTKQKRKQIIQIVTPYRHKRRTAPPATPQTKKTAPDNEQNSDDIQESPDTDTTAATQDIFPGYHGETTIDGTPDGQGTMIYRNGEKYEGHWKKGVREGYGIFFFSTGQKYSGMWSAGEMHGEGAYLLPDGSRYYGSMKHNTISGYGECFYQDGTRYRGEWKNGMWHGCGTYFHPDGRSVAAFFLNQQIIHSFNSEEECRKWRTENTPTNQIEQKPKQPSGKPKLR